MSGDEEGLQRRGVSQAGHQSERITKFLGQVLRQNSDQKKGVKRGYHTQIKLAGPAPNKLFDWPGTGVREGGHADNTSRVLCSLSLSLFITTVLLWHHEKAADLPTSSALFWPIISYGIPASIFNDSRKTSGIILSKHYCLPIRSCSINLDPSRLSVSITLRGPNPPRVELLVLISTPRYPFYSQNLSISIRGSCFYSVLCWLVSWYNNCFI